jgi:cbb3-type cytochrome oxidase maturation protein
MVWEWNEIISAMEALYILIPTSLLIVAFAVWIFFKMSDSGQFDDLEGDGQRILLDDDRAKITEAPVDTKSD